MNNYIGQYGFPQYMYPQQNRMNQEQQYSNVYPNYYGVNQQQQIQQTLKGRPVSSYDEAKASMIDLDGSLFVFTDVTNKRIYTKQILLDGSAEFKTYVLQEQKESNKEVNEDTNNYVLKRDFEKAINILGREIEQLKGGFVDEAVNK